MLLLSKKYQWLKMSSEIDRDNRRFKRYDCYKETQVSFKGKKYNLQAINYSLKGMGFYFDESLTIPVRSLGHFKIEDLGIDDEGKIIWCKKVDSKLRIGIERKTISGLLSVYPLDDMLFDLKQNEMNGILELRKEAIIKKIFIKNGEIIFATSNKTEDRLIEIMLKTGRITNDQYYQLINFSKKTGKSQGAAIVALGYLKPDELTSAIRTQIEEIILSLFQWQDAKFIFFDGHVLPDKIIKIRLDITNIVYNGYKRISNIVYIKNSLPPMATILHPSHNLSNFLNNIKLDKMEKDIIELINGNRSIQEIINISPYDTQKTMKTLFSLIKARVINIKKSDLQEDKYEQEFIDKIEDLYQRLDLSDYYSILGVEKWATLDKIKKAYYAAAKEFHPDKHKELPTEIVKNKLNAIFTYLTEAYKVLSQSDERMKYDQSLSTSHAIKKKSNKEIAREKYEQGTIAINKGEYDKAIKLFEQALYLDSTVPDYHFYLGMALKGNKKYNEAARIINNALKLDPFNSEYLTELGYIFIQLGFLLRAKGTFEKAIKIDSNNEHAISGLRKIKELQ